MTMNFLGVDLWLLFHHLYTRLRMVLSLSKIDSCQDEPYQSICTYSPIMGTSIKHIWSLQETTILVAVGFDRGHLEKS